jgi:1-phosphofructokinase
MVAAFAYAWDHQFGKEETVKLCMATSAGAVTTVGTKPPSKELVDELIKQVKVARIRE